MTTKNNEICHWKVVRHANERWWDMPTNSVEISWHMIMRYDNEG
jgi:hypothetical protein